MQSKVQSQDVVPRPGPVVDVEQAEAALVEHYPRLVRLAYLVLPPSLGRNRRVLTAHSLTQRALPRARTSADAAAVPAPRTAEGRNGDPGYGFVRLRVLRTALDAGRPLRRRAWPRRSQLPPLLPQVWGLRLFPRSGGADELALDQGLSALSGPGRAAFVLRGLERLDDRAVRNMLAAAGAEDPDAALAEADGVALPAGKDALALLESTEFDPCSLQARPPDLMRRRQHVKAVIAAAAATLVCGALLGLPGGGWAPDGAAAPAYAQNPAGLAALDPGRLTRVPATAWQTSARTDFSVWPAARLPDRRPAAAAACSRGLGAARRLRPGLRDTGHPGRLAPPGPPQLLYAGEVDQARIVLFYDGLRIVRYAEPKDGTSGAALDFARADGATGPEAGALVVDRADGNVRYLTAPWVRGAAVRNLLKPSAAPMPLGRAPDGVTTPFASPALARDCASWNALALRDDAGTRLSTDLGELVPAHLTAGRPGAPREAVAADWQHSACSLTSVRSHGVRTVNSWAYARQQLPEGSGAADWVCARADTWRGGGARTLALFTAPGGTTAAVAAKSEGTPACGSRDPLVLAGVLWKSRGGTWYVVAAASRQVTSIASSGGARARDNVLAAPTRQGARTKLTGRTSTGREVGALR